MFIRILSSVTGLAILSIACFYSQIGISIVVFFLMCLCLHEFYGAMYEAGYNPIKSIGYISAIFLIIVGICKNYNTNFPICILGCASFLIVIASFIVMVIRSSKCNVLDVSLTFVSIIYIDILFYFIILTSLLSKNLFYLYIVFIGAWSTDTFAYFAGLLLGKTKLIPDVSPKKTVQGSIGGLLGCMLFVWLYGYISVKTGFAPYHIPMYNFVVLGFFLGIISQLGDLVASCIKRFAKVKDFGRIMPGHGGMLDRFDSILFVAPVVYLYFEILNYILKTGHI